MNNEPTYAQINTTYRWLCWVMPTPEAQDAAQYMKTKTRKEASVEMGRLCDMKRAHKLTREEVFNGKFWEDYHRLD